MLHELFGKKGALSVCLVVILSSFVVTSSSGQTVVKKDSSYRTNVRYRGVFANTTYDFVVSLSPSVVSSCIYNTTEKNRIEADFPSWTFTNSTSLLNGSFDIVHYDVGLAEQVGSTLNWEPIIKHDMQVDYNISGVTFTLPSGYVLHWIQFVYTNYPIPGNPTPSVDPTYWNGVKDWEDNLPFYWTKTENKTYSNIGNVKLRFLDRPARPFSGILTKPSKTVLWKAHLYLVMWNQSSPGTVIVNYRGVEWGFKITATATTAAVPTGVRKYTHGGVAGDKFGWIPGERLNSTAAVGGYFVPVNKFELLAPYISLVSLMTIATLSIVYVKYRKKKQT